MKPRSKAHVFSAFALIVILAVMAAAAEFDPPIIIESPEPVREGWFGTPSSVPDVNGDGRRDILIGAGGAGGRVFLFNGFTRQLLREFSGNGGVGIDDLNGDGRGDLVLGDGDYRVNVFSGATGEILFGLEPSSLYVRDMSVVPDLNGDGRQDIIIGKVNFDDGSNSGAVEIHDGSSGAELWTAQGKGLFGESVSGIPDVNGDGRGDVIVGAPQGNRAYIYDGATGALLRTFAGSGGFGRSVAGLSDVSGDDRGDVVVTAVSARRAYLYDGATGALLQTLRAPGDPAFFGWRLDRLPDVDGDGREDVVVGPPHAPDAPQSPGEVYLFSGVTGELLATLPGYVVGGSATGIPDVNGDGLGEVLVANPRANSTSGIFQAGQALLYLSKPSPPRPAALGLGPEGFKIRLTGQVGLKFELQRSEDLTRWLSIATPTQTNHTIEFLDTEASSAPHRFYRTRTFPSP